MFETIMQPLHLQGALVELRHVREDDAEELFRIGQDERIWPYMVRGPITSVEDGRQFLRMFIAEREAGRIVPFSVLSRAKGDLIGFTLYLDIQPVHRSLEIGYTFVHPDYWGTGAAEECQFLLARHAIEVLGAGRVVLKTDARNIRAQRALEHFGITKEGVLRKHLMVRDGFVRDTVMYSIIAEEWPALAARGAAMFQPASS